MPYRIPLNVRNYNDKGCVHRNVEFGTCTNTGKVMQYDKNVSITTCPNCYYKDSQLLQQINPT